MAMDIWLKDMQPSISSRTKAWVEVEKCPGGPQYGYR